MGKRKKAVQNNNLQVALFFAVFVGSLLIISLAFKFVLLVKQSSFDGSNRFTILLSNGKMDKKVISVSPETQALSLLTIHGSIAASRVSRFLETPIDGKITYTKEVEDYSQKSTEELFRSFIIGYKNLTTDLTIIDLVRLWHFSRTLSSSSITASDISSTLEEGRIDKISYSLFNDQSILEEKMSIQIINGAEVSGLGNRLARFITNIGGNVIAVATADKEIKKSEIIYVGEEKPYTVLRLEKILGFPAVKTTKVGLSDITIQVGKDRLNSLVF